MCNGAEVLTEKLEGLRGRLVKVVYRDIDHDSVIKGDLVRVDGDFIELRSFRNSYVIRVDQILKIVSALEPAGFDSFARLCAHRVGCSPPVCNYHDSSPGDCKPEFCQLWEKLRGVGHGER